MSVIIDRSHKNNIILLSIFPSNLLLFASSFIYTFRLHKSARTFFSFENIEYKAEKGLTTAAHKTQSMGINRLDQHSNITE